MFCLAIPRLVARAANHLEDQLPSAAVFSLLERDAVPPLFLQGSHDGFTSFPTQYSAVVTSTVSMGIAASHRTVQRPTRRHSPGSPHQTAQSELLAFLLTSSLLHKTILIAQSSVFS